MTSHPEGDALFSDLLDEPSRSPVPVVEVTRLRGLAKPHGQREVFTWPELATFLATPGPKPTDPKEPKLSGWSPATFTNDWRNKSNVETVTALGLDHDKGGLSLEALREIYEGKRALAHNTRRATPEAQRWRVVVAVSRPMTLDEHAIVWRHARDGLAERGVIIDEQTKDPSRFWFVPCVPVEGPFVSESLEGEPLDVDAILRDQAEADARAARAKPLPVDVSARPMSTSAAPSTDERSTIDRVTMATRRRRAAKYLERAEPSVSGEGGHNVAMRVVSAVVRGFALDEASALEVLSAWNARCEPSWTPQELRHKVDEAVRVGAMPFGALLLKSAGEPASPERKADPSPPARPATPAERVRALAKLGPVVRLPTGIPTFDRGCRGGVPAPRFVVLGGAPGAGKTTLATWLGWRWAKAGIPVAMLAVDEGPDGVLMRIAQLEGLEPAAIEERREDVLEELATRLDAAPLVIVDGDDAGGTVEGAAALLTDFPADLPRVLIIDSIQTVRATGTDGADSPRERIDAVVRAAKAARDGHALLVIATCELSRGAYRSRSAAEAINDLAAFKESGGIEYAAQTALVLRSVADAPNLVDVTVPKNRAYKRDPFRLRLDHRTTAFEEVEMAAEPLEGAKAEHKLGQVRRAIVDAVGSAELRSARAIVRAVRDAGHRLRDQDVFDVVRAMRGDGVLVREDDKAFRIVVATDGTEGEEDSDEA
ncbi:MAG: AAA family ATPase [Labilithrix sp.]|nr:AAA family ATPase [Labilithrix sp.]